MKNQTWKKAFCKTIALIMSASLIASCGKDSEDAVGGVATPNEDGKVTLTITDWETENLNEAMQKAFDEEFSKNNPDITVKIVPAPLGDYSVKIGQMISSGLAPDIFQLGEDNTYSFMEKDLLYDWRDYLAKDENLPNEAYPGIFDAWVAEDGTVLGLPGLINVTGIFYNKDWRKLDWMNRKMDGHMRKCSPMQRH